MADNPTEKQPAPADVWSSGAAYEQYVGRWSRVVARRFVQWLDVSAGSRWLDIGCGTGALSQTILRNAEPVAVHGIEPSSAFLALARQQVQDERARFDPG